MCVMLQFWDPDLRLFGIWLLIKVNDGDASWWFTDRFALSDPDRAKCVLTNYHILMPIMDPQKKCTDSYMTERDQWPKTGQN